MVFSGSGAGTSGDPYQITSWAQLQEINNDLDKYFILMNDLNSTTTGYATYASSTANSGAGWNPIGNTSSNLFTGVFYGNNKNIDDLYISRNTTNYVALFGYLGDKAEITNLNMNAADITDSSGRVAILVGILWSGDDIIIRNCHVQGEVTAGANGRCGGLIAWAGRTCLIEFCSTNVTISSSGINTGGFVGVLDNGYTVNPFIIRYCYSSGSVTSTSYYVGGFVGAMQHSNSTYNININNCYSKTNVVGNHNFTSVAGFLAGTNSPNSAIVVNKCYCVGTVVNNGDGDARPFSAARTGNTITNNFWDTTVSSITVAGTNGGTGKTTTEMKDIDTFTDTATVGLDEAYDMVLEASVYNEDWFINDGVDYPELNFSNAYPKFLYSYSIIVSQQTHTLNSESKIIGAANIESSSYIINTNTNIINSYSNITDILNVDTSYNVDVMNGAFYYNGLTSYTSFEDYLNDEDITFSIVLWIKPEDPVLHSSLQAANTTQIQNFELDTNSMGDFYPQQYIFNRGVNSPSITIGGYKPGGSSELRIISFNMGTSVVEYEHEYPETINDEVVMVSMIYVRGRINCYVNKTYVGSMSSEISLGDFVIELARPVSGVTSVDGAYYKGYLSKLSIYKDRELNFDDIVTLYNHNLGLEFENLTVLKNIFFGRIDNVKYNFNDSEGFTVNIDGRDVPEMIDRTVTKTGIATTIDRAIYSIIQDVDSDIVLQFWDGRSWCNSSYDSLTQEVSWSSPVNNLPSDLLNFSVQDVKTWTLIKDLCKKIDLDVYFDYDNVNNVRVIRVSLINDIGRISDEEVVHYKFSNNLLDSSSHGNDGVGVNIDYIDAKIGIGALLNNSSITVPVLTNLLTEYSISFWFKPYNIIDDSSILYIQDFLELIISESNITVSDSAYTYTVHSDVDSFEQSNCGWSFVDDAGFTYYNLWSTVGDYSLLMNTLGSLSMYKDITATSVTFDAKLISGSGRLEIYDSTNALIKTVSFETSEMLDEVVNISNTGQILFKIISDDDVSLTIAIDNIRYNSSVNKVPDYDVFNHCIITNDGTTLKLFINNEEVVSGVADSFTSIFNNIVIGDGTSSNFNGIIDDFRCFSKVISADERSSIYNYGFGTRSGVGMTDYDITQGVNLTNVSEFGSDSSNLVNRVKVYGDAPSDNIVNLHTSEDLDLQTQFWIKDKIITDSSLRTRDEVVSKSDVELKLSIDLDYTGSVSAVGILGVDPSRLINIAVPNCNISGAYRVQRVNYGLSEPLDVTIDVSRKQDTVRDLFINRFNPDDLIHTSNNINDMRGSYAVMFTEEPAIVTLSGAEIRENRLRLSDSATTGTAISDTITLARNITQCEFRRFENFVTDLDTYEVSNDGGVSWELIDRDSGRIHTFAKSGNLLKFRITLNRVLVTDLTPMYEAVTVLYK